MTASNDAVLSDRGSESAPRRRHPWLLTTAVLMLIYQKVPPPFGVTAIQEWLYYAIWGAGSLLLAQYLRDTTRSARTVGRRAAAKLRRMRAGFQFIYGPGQDHPRRNTAAEDGGNIQNQRSLVPDRSAGDGDGS